MSRLLNAGPSPGEVREALALARLQYAAPIMSPDARPADHCLYRHFDGSGVLLYVGITSRIGERIRDHKRHSCWWLEITRIEIERFASRAELIEAEKAAIRSENPLHNVRNRERKTEQSKWPKQGRPFLVAGREITARLIELRPLYTLREASDLIGVSGMMLHKQIREGRLSIIELESPKSDRRVQYVTGWQLLAWLELITEESASGE